MSLLGRCYQLLLGCAVLAVGLTVEAADSSPQSKATLDGLKKLEITCFVPSYLPKGFKLATVEITYDEPGPDEKSEGKFPLYAIEWTGPEKAAFSIDSAREGIGDRNLMEEENSEETELPSPLGPVYIIYTPKGKAGVKKEIIANWIADANMKRETEQEKLAHAVLGRFHGCTGRNITVAEFGKIVASLQPLRDAASPPPNTAAAPRTTPKLHPKIFSMIESWISDSESPVVTEINLDAVEKDGNQFDWDAVTQEDGWTRCPGAEPNSFMRCRILETKGNHYQVEYQENGGGSFTSASIIDFTIEQREITRDGHPAAITVLRVSSCRTKKA